MEICEAKIRVDRILMELKITNRPNIIKIIKNIILRICIYDS